jgi:RimJ/RimL family protein N-acetyltransferase
VQAQSRVEYCSGRPEASPYAPPVVAPRIPEELATARLVLRRWRPNDLDALAEVFALPEVWEFPFGRGLTREETAHYLSQFLESWARDGYGMYALELLGTDRLIGFTGIRLATWFSEIDGNIEIGWRLHPECWRKGYATEAAMASLRVGFSELGPERIVAVVEPANSASLRLAERLGMRVVRRVVEPRLQKTLEVCVVERARYGALVDPPSGASGSGEDGAVVEGDDIVAELGEIRVVRRDDDGHPTPRRA